MEISGDDWGGESSRGGIETTVLQKQFKNVGKNKIQGIKISGMQLKQFLKENV